MLKDKALLKKERKQRIRKRIRKKIKGTADRPRVFVFKSNRYIYVQAINDLDGTVIASASSLEKDIRESGKSTKNKETCQLVGERLAQRLKEKNITKIVFDRGIYPYHGRIKVLAETLRQHGLSF